MTIPDFINGLIPPFKGEPVSSDRSPYIISLVELVERFGTNSHRKLLLRNFIKYREMLSKEGYVQGIQFIDGSFVEDLKGRDPNDIDLFSFLGVPQKYLENDSKWTEGGYIFLNEEVLNRDKNKERFKLDTHGVLYESCDHWEFMKLVIYWYSLFSHQRDTFAWKGFVCVTMDRTDDDRALAMLGTA